MEMKTFLAAHESQLMPITLLSGFSFEICNKLLYLGVAISLYLLYLVVLAKHSRMSFRKDLVNIVCNWQSQTTFKSTTTDATKMHF